MAGKSQVLMELLELQYLLCGGGVLLEIRENLVVGGAARSVTFCWCERSICRKTDAASNTVPGSGVGG